MSDLSNTSETPVTAPAEMPAWYDEALHRVADGGIFETATGVLLDEDGEPKSLAVRRLRAEAAAEAAAAPAKAVKKPRDTRQIVESAAAAAAE